MKEKKYVVLYSSKWSEEKRARVVSWPSAGAFWREKNGELIGTGTIAGIAIVAGLLLGVVLWIVVGDLGSFLVGTGFGVAVAVIVFGRWLWWKAAGGAKQRPMGGWTLVADLPEKWLTAMDDGESSPAVDKDFIVWAIAEEKVRLAESRRARLEELKDPDMFDFRAALDREVAEAAEVRDIRADEVEVSIAVWIFDHRDGEGR